MNSAETKVNNPAAAGPECPVRSLALGIRAAINSPPMTNSIPAMTASGTNSARLPNSKRIRASHSPAKIPPQRDWLPAPTLMPVRDGGPPVPMDWKKLPSGLPMPSPMKS
ncbi:MAG: hypothetical protein R2844_13815 [Caldilineales bacterium]